MSLTDEDVRIIQKVLRPLEDRILSLEGRMDERFNVMDQNFDALFRFNETREQEHLVISNQIDRIDSRVSELEAKDSSG